MPPTRIQYGMRSAIVDVFAVGAMKDHYSEKSLISGPCDHDIQLVVINNINPVVINYSCRKKLIK
jgi:hypothetical protein